MGVELHTILNHPLWQLSQRSGESEIIHQVGQGSQQDV